MSRKGFTKVTTYHESDSGPGGYLRLSNANKAGGGFTKTTTIHTKMPNGGGISKVTNVQTKYTNGGTFPRINVHTAPRVGSNVQRKTVREINYTKPSSLKTSSPMDIGYLRITNTQKNHANGGYSPVSKVQKTSNLSGTFSQKYSPDKDFLDVSYTTRGRSADKNGYSTNGPFCVQQRPWTPTKRRGPISAEFATPGPADISLPSTFGPQQKDTTRSKSPAFTFAGKHEEKNKFLTPGPGAYEVSGVVRTGKEVHAGPTISGRMKEPEPYKTPAPGDYTPEKYDKTVLNASPSYTFGYKAKDLKPDEIPAPGAYDPDKSCRNVLDTSPCYTFGMKHRDIKPDVIPAPGAYSPEKVDKSVHQASPSFTFGIKHKEPKAENIPAPGTYCPEKSDKALNNAPSYTFGNKHKELKPDDVPAPNSYNIPELMTKEGPSYTIGGKEGDIWGTNKNPGPGSYNVPGSEVFKQKSPAFTISARTTLPGDKTQKPGPGTHSPEKVVMKHTPSFSFGIRHSPFAHGFGDKSSQVKVMQVQHVQRKIVSK